MLIPLPLAPPYHTCKKPMACAPLPSPCSPRKSSCTSRAGGPLPETISFLLQVKLRVCHLFGVLPSNRNNVQLGISGPSSAALFVTARLLADGESWGLETKTTYAESDRYACTWGEWLTFCIKVHGPGAAAVDELHLSVAIY